MSTLEGVTVPVNSETFSIFFHTFWRHVMEFLSLCFWLRCAIKSLHCLFKYKLCRFFSPHGVHAVMLFLAARGSHLMRRWGVRNCSPFHYRLASLSKLPTKTLAYLITSHSQVYTHMYMQADSCCHMVNSEWTVYKCMKLKLVFKTSGYVHITCN